MQKIKWTIWEKSRLPEMGRNISRTFSQVKNNIGNFFKSIPGTVSRMRGGVESGLTKFRARVTEIVKGAGRGISTAWNNATGWVGRTSRNMKRNVESTLTGFRANVTSIFKGIGRTASTIWNNITGSIGGAVRRAKKAVTDTLGGMRISAGNIFRGIGRTARAIWSGISSSIGSIVGKIRRSTVGKFSELKTSVVRVFNQMRIGLASAWAKVRAAARAPVEYVVNTVFNKGLRKAFNTINNVIPGVPDIPPIKFGGGSAAGGSRPASDRGFARGGHTGPGPKFQPAGIVHADEFVIKKESRKRIEQNMPGLLDYMNAAGKLPGFASGGLVAAANWWRKLGARASEHPAFGGVHAGHMKGSLHYSGNAVDLNYGPSGENNIEKAFFDKYIGQFKAKFPGLGVLWRVADHFNHMHIDTSGIRKGGGGGGGLPSLASLINPLKGLTGMLDSGAGKGKLGSLLRGLGRKMIFGGVDLVKNKFASMAESAGDFIGKLFGGGGSGGSVRNTVRQIAGQRGWGDGAQWDALNWLVNKESGWNPKAANPTSSARGLFQKMTSVHGPIEKTVAGQAAWGLNYIKKRYGNPVNAAKFHRSHGYYAGGGLVKRIHDAGIFDSGGVLAPGMNLVNNKTGGFEKLVRPEQYSPKGLAAEYRALTRVIERAFGASGQMASAGAQVVAGLVNGMRSGAPSVAEAAVSVSRAAISATQSTLDIHSPSRVFRGFGLNIVKGLVAGVVAGRDELSKTLAKMVDSITDYAEDRVDNYADNILEKYRRANKKITEYNKKHKNNKDLLTAPTAKQAEEIAMRRLGFDKKAIARANSLVKNLTKVTKDRWDDGTDKGLKSVLSAVRRFSTASTLWRKITLGDLARGAEVLGARLESAREKLDGMMESYRDMSSGISDSISGSLELTGTGSIQGISGKVKDLAAKAKKLAPLLQKLIKNGMPKAFVQQIAGLGIEDAISVAEDILAGTGAEQRALFRDFSAIDTNADKVGDIVAEQMYGVGLSAQRGLVKGLEKDQKTLEAAARKLAKKLEKAIKDELGIKSPSRVFAEIGRFLPQGLALGIDADSSAAIDAASRLSADVTSAFSPDLTAEARVNGTSVTTPTTSTEETDANGLTARDRAIIAAIEALDKGTTIVVNPPAETDVHTLATLIMRETAFRRI